MMTREELWNDIVAYATSTLGTPEDKELQVDICATLDEVYKDLAGYADLRAHVGELEEERNQARENEAVALRDLNDTEKRLDSAIERAHAFETSLLIVLMDRASGNDENVRRIGELLLEKDAAKVDARVAFERTVERCAKVAEKSAQEVENQNLGTARAAALREAATRIRATVFEP